MIGFSTSFCIQCNHRFKCPVRSVSGEFDFYLQVNKNLYPITHELLCIKQIVVTGGTVNAIITYKDDFLEEMFIELENNPVKNVAAQNMVAYLYKTLKGKLNDWV